jgi:alcohol dehydrogenase class IV
MFELRIWFYKALMFLLKGVEFLMPQGKPLIMTGAGSSIELCATMRRFGHKRVLLVTDKVLHELGVLQPMMDALDAHGMQVTVFDGVLPDPTYTQVEEGVALGRSIGADAVLAVGGGSPIDAAKVIAAGLTNPVPIKKLTGIRKVKKPSLPLYVVPSTAGTGSEVTMAAVVSDPESHEKTPVIDPDTIPVAAALDPEVQMGMPPAITAATGMDALTHAVEAYLSKKATPETDRYALAAARMIFECLPRAYADGNDMEAREALALASCYAGLAFTKAYVGYVHAIAHTFGARYGTPHGLANAIVMPYILEYSLDAASDRMADLAVAAKLGEPQDGRRLLAQRLVDRVREMNVELGVPETLEALRPQDISDIAKTALHEAHFLYPVPKYMDQPRCEAILRRMVA